MIQYRTVIEYVELDEEGLPKRAEITDDDGMVTGHGDELPSSRLVFEGQPSVEACVAVADRAVADIVSADNLQLVGEARTESREVADWELTA